MLGTLKVCRKGSGDSQLFPKGPRLGNLEGLSTGDFERWMKGDLGWSFSEEAPWRGPSLRTLEDMLRKAPHMGDSLLGGPFTTKGNLESGGGSHIPGTLKDE